MSILITEGKIDSTLVSDFMKKSDINFDGSNICNPRDLFLIAADDGIIVGMAIIKEIDLSMAEIIYIKFRDYHELSMLINEIDLRAFSLGYNYIIAQTANLVNGVIKPMTENGFIVANSIMAHKV